MHRNDTINMRRKGNIDVSNKLKKFCPPPPIKTKVINKFYLALSYTHVHAHTHKFHTKPPHVKIFSHTTFSLEHEPYLFFCKHVCKQ